jgi:hypothetical protein
MTTEADKTDTDEIDLSTDKMLEAMRALNDELALKYGIHDSIDLRLAILDRVLDSFGDLAPEDVVDAAEAIYQWVTKGAETLQ